MTNRALIRQLLRYPMNANICFKRVTCQGQMISYEAIKDTSHSVHTSTKSTVLLHPTKQPRSLSRVK